MAEHGQNGEASAGRSIAVPLAVFGVLALVLGGVRMASGVDGSFVVVLAGVTFLVGAVLAIRLAR